MPVFRRLAASVSETTLAGVGRPSGFGGAGPRAGGVTTLDWYAVFVDAAGRRMTGGEVTVQWYALDVAADGSVTAPTLGAEVAVDALEIKRKGFAATLWPWCTVVATPPTVEAKVINIDVGGSADGVYSIAVIGEEEPYEFTASSDSEDDIRDGLIALFAAHETLAAAIVGAGVLSLISDPGVDFEVELDSPGDTMTASEEAPYIPAPEFVEIVTAASAAVEVDSDAVAVAIAGVDFEAAAAAAIVDACAVNGSIRTTVRPTGGGDGQVYVDGPDAGGGAAHYQIVGAQANRIFVQHFMISADKPITWSLWSASTAAILGPFPADTGQPPTEYTAGAGGFRRAQTNQNEALILRVSDRTAEVTISYYAAITDD